MKGKTKILFRADGNSQIGLGHIMRCLGLAEILKDSFELEFAIRSPDEGILAQIQKGCLKIKKLPEMDLLQEAEALAAGLTGNEIVVLDGYHFSTNYQQVLKQKGSVLVFIDDLHDRKIVADVVLNSAGGVDPAGYEVAPYTRLCLGPDFALLRKPFREAQKNVPALVQTITRLLVCFGGADPENYTLKYVQQLTEQKEELKLEIITGSAYSHREALASYVEGKRYLSWHKNLSAEALAGLMQECEAAICSASVISYEYCSVTGLLFVEKTAENQADLYQYLISSGLALPAKELLLKLSDGTAGSKAEEMQKRQRQVFNGQAEQNLVALFALLDLQAQLTFRKFTSEDTDLLFAWSNDPVVRQFSFNPEPIPYDTHVNWVRNKLSNPDSLLLIAEIQDQPAAHLRFDRSGTTALISYQIGAAFRGKGLGHRVLQLGIKTLLSYFPDITEAIGFVQPVNVASVRAFEKAEFKNLGFEEKQQAFKFQKIL